MSIFKVQDIDTILLSFLDIDTLRKLYQVNTYYRNQTRDKLLSYIQFFKNKETIKLVIKYQECEFECKLEDDCKLNYFYRNKLEAFLKSLYFQNRNVTKYILNKFPTFDNGPYFFKPLLKKFPGCEIVFYMYSKNNGKGRQHRESLSDFVSMLIVHNGYDLIKDF